MKILLTGFEPFGKVLDNPSQRVVEHFAAKGQENLITAVLPVDYRGASAILAGLLETHQPDAVLMLGVAQMRDSINLERIAININDAKIADNAGNLKSGQAIVDDAPVAYRSTLPLEAMYQAIQDAGIAVNYSNHAGAYLCNHVFFYARHHLETAGMGHIPCGFIHLPDMGEEAPKMPLSKMILAVNVAIEILGSETIKNSLEHLRLKLSRTPEWIVVVTIDGQFIAGTSLTPRKDYKEENRIGPLVMALSSLAQTVNDELILGDASVIWTVGNLGILSILPLENDYIVALKFSKEASGSTLAGNDIESLRGLATMLGESPLTRYSR